MQDSPLNDIRIGQVTDHWAKAQKIASRYFPSTESTNCKAKEEAFTEEAFSEQLILYVTDHQTAGRGRGQNTWSDSDTGAQLLSTWSFMLEQVLPPTTAPMVGLALYRAAIATWPFLEWSLKAPNDLYIKNKKVAGLLLETVSQGEDHRLLVGLGLNVIAAPEGIDTATCLVKELPPQTPLLAEDWIAFLERLIFELAFSIQLAHEPLNSTSSQSLLSALNRHPLLKEKYTALDQHGNLSTPSKQISWTEL